jgi:hypothetical protein
VWRRRRPASLPSLTVKQTYSGALFAAVTKFEADFRLLIDRHSLIIFGVAADWSISAIIPYET